MNAVKADIEKAVNKYGDMLFRLSVVMLGNDSDAEDVVQETIIKYMEKAPSFNDDEHEKAWLIKVAVNKCKDLLRKRKRYSYTETEKECVTASETTGVFEALMSIPDKYRIVMVLFYVEDYKVEEIAGIICRTPSAVKMRLKKGRELLRDEYKRRYM